MTMPSLWSLLHAPTVELLGWTLLHFVWQGALVAAVLAGALYLLRTHSPRVRYVVSCAALLGLLALPVGTGVVLNGSGIPTVSAPSSSTVALETAATIAEASRASAMEPAGATTPSWRTRAASWVQPALPWVVLAWGLGVIVFAVRLGGGAWRVRRLRWSSSAAPSKWSDRLQALADRMGATTSVGLRQSNRVDGPVLAGWWRPVILVPAGFLSGLPPAQVEALLLHELAHVRRHDVLVGRLQAVVETLLFFHPATWWISKNVRQAREACCDDLVVQAGSERTTYAQALTALAERAVEGRATAWAPAASGGSLLDRIQRLVVPPEAPSTAGRRLSIVAAALLMVTVPLGLAACASQQSTTGAESPPAPAAAEAEEPEAPATPSREAEQRVVVIQDDSTERAFRIESKGPVEVDSLEEDVYVFRYGDRVDTVDVPSLDGLKGVPHPPVPPDSLERSFRPPFDPDSLERVMEARFDPDSLERVILSRVNPDSIERALRLRFDRDSLEQHMRRMERRADSIAQRFAERWQTRDFPDSTFVFRFDGFDPDEFDREDFEFDLDVDSLIHRQKEHADSLRRHFEQMREHWEERSRRMEREVPERLREEARRLREQAERLEERAEEMEAPTSPDEPEASGDTSKVDGSSVRVPNDIVDQPAQYALGENTVRFDEDQSAQWARQVANRLDYDELLK